MSNSSAKTSRNWILIAGGVAGGSVPAAELVALSPWGSFGLVLWKMVVLFAALAVVAAAIFSLIRLLIAVALRHTRLHWLNVCAAWIGCAIFIYAGLHTSALVRETRFMALATRSEPLISAIEDYSHTRGSPPADLGALVPRYFAQVPKTGMGAYPEYRYIVPGRADNPWAIVVRTPNGPLDFDEFLYLPRKNYEDNGIGVPKRIGDWAYIYE